MLYKTIELILLLASLGWVNQNGWQSGIFTGKFIRIQDDIEMRGGYFGEIILHKSLVSTFLVCEALMALSMMFA